MSTTNNQENSLFGSNRELPPQQVNALHSAVRWEWITLGVMVVTLTMVLLLAGSSQAMKAAWIEDLLSLLPPIAFLVAVRFIRRRPTRRHPFGYHRAIEVAHLVAAVALLFMGGYLLVDSGMGLITLEHPPIGVINVFGTPIWAGWLMVGVLLLTGIPPVILGRIKMKLAQQLHDKVLYADADMNRADWLTALASTIGVLGIGAGLWWADAAAAIFISYSIISDGWKNLRGAVQDLMDTRATQFDGTDPDPLIDELTGALLSLPWVAEAICRVRDMGHVLHVEAFVVPQEADGNVDLDQLETARQRCFEVSWRVEDVAIIPVKSKVKRK